MELTLQQNMFDDVFGELDSWYHDVTSSQFYAEDNILTKPGNIMHSVKDETKYSHMVSKTSTLLTLNNLDARVPEYEASTRSLSCSSSEEAVSTIKVHPQKHKNNSWDGFFGSKNPNPMVGVNSDDSISQISSYIVPDIVDENETFRDLTELLEQEYPLSKDISQNSLGNDLHTLEVPCSSKSSIASRAEDSRSPQPSLIGTFVVDLSPESPSSGKKVDTRYKEMRRKNNIASKNARVARRDKERQMEERAKQLEEDNQALRIKVRKMEELAQELKTRLIKSVTRSK